ncbi:MAG: PDZ domain-containing protein [Planctomycetales bacterium]|nr:PDZ domain-containing protein [Planctomycetales bacterium]
MSCTRLRVILSRWASAAAFALLALAAHAAESSPGDAEIAALLKQLSAPRFADRELATQQLIDAGPAVIEPVAANVRSAEREALARGLQVLRQMGLSDNETTEDAARAALERLAADEKSKASGPARRELDYLNDVRQDRAIAAIRKLGGVVDENVYNQFLGAWRIVTTFSVTIDENWTGGEKGLKYLRWLPELRMVRFRGKQVEDAWLKSVEGLPRVNILELNRTSVGDAGLAAAQRMPGLDQLAVKYSPVTDKSVEHLKQLQGASIIMLYGTEMTPEGAEALRTATAAANVKIDYRRGAFLGVGCQQTELGCTITSVHEGSAADKADIRPGDVVFEYAGKPVEDFQSLTKLIGENVAGDKVAIKVRRGGADLPVIELTLGEWE